MLNRTKYDIANDPEMLTRLILKKSNKSAIFQDLEHGDVESVHYRYSVIYCCFTSLLEEGVIDPKKHKYNQSQNSYTIKRVVSVKKVRNFLRRIQQPQFSVNLEANLEWSQSTKPKNNESIDVDVINVAYSPVKDIAKYDFINTVKEEPYLSVSLRCNSIDRGTKQLFLRES